MISLKNITIGIENNIILKDVSLAFGQGSFNLIIGHNGSGKSSLCRYLLGDPEYKKVSGAAHFEGIDLETLDMVERAQKGLFVVQQEHIEIPGLPVSTFLKAAYESLVGPIDDIVSFFNHVKKLCDFVGLDHSFIERSVNEGFSGGQKKRFEMVQLLLFKPSYIILDEIDSGLDEQGCIVLIKMMKSIIVEKPSVCFVVISHRPDLFACFEHKIVYRLSKGSII